MGAETTALPVLFLVFRRPEQTARVFESIRAARPPRLYVAADGPRSVDEWTLCDEARRIATEVDWPCKLETLFRDSNLGCRCAVGGAVDWFFANEERGAILEDDCVPGDSWFPFAEQMLERYESDERIMCVSANHFHGQAHEPPHSYFFSRYNHCWGWASWRRAWKLYDADMRQWPALRDTGWLLELGGGDRAFARYWTRMFDLACEGKVDSWAYRWTFSCWLHGGLTVLPSRNLVTNVGFGDEGTHTRDADSTVANLPIERLRFPLTHPASVQRDAAADRWTDANVFRVRDALFHRRVGARVKRLVRNAIGLA